MRCEIEILQKQLECDISKHTIEPKCKIIATDFDNNINVYAFYINKQRVSDIVVLCSTQSHSRSYSYINELDVKY
jgi:hypothetical protein